MQRTPAKHLRRVVPQRALARRERELVGASGHHNWQSASSRREGRLWRFTSQQFRYNLSSTGRRDNQRLSKPQFI